MRKYFLLVIIILFVNCSKSPEPIKYGHDSCENCRMLITDHKYGSELITSKGRIYKFDSIECLADYSIKLENSVIGSMWVTNFSNPHELINVNTAIFLKSENLRSPMGLNLSAFSSYPEMENIKKQYGGDKIQWNDLVNYVTKKWHDE